MKPRPYHIYAKSGNSGKLFAMPMPSADSLRTELQALQHSGIEKIVCLLETTESQRLGLSEQEAISEEIGISFQRLPVKDYGVPDLVHLIRQAEDIAADLEAGKSILVHCRGGIGRTGLLCCCVLVCEGFSVTDAIATVSAKRNEQVPETQSQRQLIEQFYAAHNGTN